MNFFMKNGHLLLTIFVFALIGIMAQDFCGQNKTLEKDVVILSRAFGNHIGSKLEIYDNKFDVEALIQGIREGASGKPSPLDKEEYYNIMSALREKQYDRYSDKMLEAANNFMQKNKDEADVVQLVPGFLHYVVLQTGNGQMVKEGESPVLKYTIRNSAGGVLIVEMDELEALPVQLDKTIPGFHQAVVGMKEGEKRKIFVHPDLAYGKESEPIPANSVVVFEVEVVSSK